MGPIESKSAPPHRPFIPHHIDTMQSTLTNLDTVIPSEHPYGLGADLSLALDRQAQMEMSGLDYTVSCRPVFYDDTAGQRNVPNARAIVNDKTGEAYKVMSERYTPFQPAQMFDLADQIIGIDGTASIDAADSFGADAVIHLKLREYDVRGDQHLDFLTIWDNRAGELGLCIFGSQGRHSCRNIIQTGIERSGGTRLRHTASIHDRVGVLVAAATAARLSGESWEQTVRQFSSWNIDGLGADQLFGDTFAAIFPEPDRKDKDQAAAVDRWEAKRGRWLAGVKRIHHSPTAKTEATNGTAYGLFGSLTEYIDAGAGGSRDKARARVASDSLNAKRKRQVAATFENAFALAMG